MKYGVSALARATLLAVALAGCAGQVFYTHPVTGKHAACAHRELGLDSVQFKQCKERLERWGYVRD